MRLLILTGRTSLISILLDLCAVAEAGTVRGGLQVAVGVDAAGAILLWNLTVFSVTFLCIQTSHICLKNILLNKFLLHGIIFILYVYYIIYYKYMYFYVYITYIS